MSSRDRIPDHPEELLLLDYLFGQLTRETSDQIKRHVGSCRECRRTIADLSLTVDELDRLPTVAIPHDAPYDVHERRPARRRGFLTYLPAAAILTVGLVILTTIGVERASRDTGGTGTTKVYVSATEDQLRAAANVPGAEASLVAWDGANHSWVVLATASATTAVLRAIRALQPGTTTVVVASR